MDEPAEPYDPARAHRRAQTMLRLAKLCFSCLRAPPEITFMKKNWWSTVRKEDEYENFCTECAAEFARGMEDPPDEAG